MNKDIADAAKQTTSSGSWRTIRVFISSTFRDMQAERDHLVRTVFPELKEMCRALRVHLIDVDLRWGVSETDAESGKAIDICLDEIDSCRPYFLGLLGHRYGYIPPGHPHSITAEEIYHGVLHTDIPKQILDLNKIIAGKLEEKTLSQQELDCLKACYIWDADRRKFLLRDKLSPKEEDILRSIFHRYSIYQKDRSYFFFRSEPFTRILAGDYPGDFIETDATKALQELKTEIREAGLPFFEYDNLDDFGQLVRDTLLAKIEAEANVDVVKKDWLEQEAEFHELFIADRTRRFVGRRELLERMRTFAETETPPPPLVISGEPGCGKSALIARFAEETMQRHPDWLVISHFVGASSASTNLRRMLRRFCTALNRALGSKEDAPEDIKELLKLFSELLAQVPNNRQLLFIIDAVNQLEKSDNAHSMSWLPQVLPENVRVVVSTLAGETQDALLARATKPQVEQVRGLSGPEIQELVKAYLSEIRHEFPNQQVEMEFFAKVEKGNPLYILVALEELRVFGKFEELGNRIRTLPDNIPDLFIQVLERIEGDFNPALVRDCMVFMACGRQGMTAEELQTLLKQHAPKIDRDIEPVKLPDLLWRKLYRSMSTYLFEHSGVIDFFHGQFKEAVGNRYLSNVTYRESIHRIIADYFEGRWREPYLRALDELPHQRTRASDWTGLEHILCDLKFIEAKAAAMMIYGLVADYNTAIKTKGFPANTDMREFAQFVSSQSHIIGVIPAITFQQAINEPDSTPPARIAAEILAAGQERRLFFQRINKPQAISACLMTLTGHDYYVTACAFSPDGSRILSKSIKTLKIWDTITGKEFATLTGHRDFINACAFSPDGTNIVSASDDGILKIWDVATGKEKATLTGHNGYSVKACAFSPDGLLLVSASCDKTLKLWNTATGKEGATLTGHKDCVTTCTFSPDGSRIVSSSWDQTLRIWDVATGKHIETLPGQDRAMTACAFSPDGSRFVSALKKNTLRLWSAATGGKIATLKGSHDRVIAFAFSPDGSLIASASIDCTLKIWDVATRKHIANLDGFNCAFSPDGTLLASGYHGGLKLWDVVNRKELGTLSGHSGAVTAFVFSPDGSLLVSASQDYTLKIWDTVSKNKRGPTDVNNKWVYACAFSADGSQIVTRSGDILIIWDAANGKELATLTGHRSSINTFAFSPDGLSIISASNDRTLKLWDATTGKEKATLTGHSGDVTACAFSPDGSLIVSSSCDSTLILWDAATGKEKATLAGHKSWVTTCAFSPDGSYILSASEDLTLKLWNTATGKEKATLAGHKGKVSACSFSPDGLRIISASYDETLKLWDAATGKEKATLTGHSGNVSACAFSPDGLRIVSASDDGTLKLWDAATGKEKATLTGHSGNVTACAFSPDGLRIVSTSNDQTLLLWDATTGTPIWEYELGGIGRAVAWSPRSHDLAVCNNIGQLLILRLHNSSYGPVVVTP